MSRTRQVFQDFLRKDIIDVTIELARTEGWQRVTTRLIADRLQTSTTAIYHYYGSKEAILVAVRDEGFRRLHQHLTDAVSDRAESPQKQLLTVSLAQFDFALQQAHLYDLMFNFTGLLTTQPASESIRETGALIQQLLESLSNQSMELLFAHWWALVNGYVGLTKMGEAMSPIARTRTLLEESINVFMKAI